RSGLETEALVQMRECEALTQVVRGFEDPAVATPPDPLRNLLNFQSELILPDLAQISYRVRRGSHGRVFKSPYHLGEGFALAHLHKCFGFEPAPPLFRRWKIEERHLGIFVPLGMNDFRKCIDTRVRYFNHGDRRFAFFLKPTDLSTESGERIKNGGFASTRESN